MDAPELDVALLAVGGGHHTAAVVEVGQVPVQLSAAEISHHSVLLAPGVEPVHDKQLGVLVSNLHTNTFTFIYLFIIYLLFIYYLFIIYLLFIYYLFIIYLLFIYYLFIIYLFIFLTSVEAR